MINIFVIGLGGGAGTGITKYILEDIHKHRKYNWDTNLCNIVFCIFPLAKEKERFKSAKAVIEYFREYSDMIFLVEMEFYRKRQIRRLTHSKFIACLNMIIISSLEDLSKFSNNKIISKIKNSKDKTISINHQDDIKNKFR